MENEAFHKSRLRIVNLKVQIVKVGVRAGKDLTRQEYRIALSELLTEDLQSTHRPKKKGS